MHEVLGSMYTGTLSKRTSPSTTVEDSGKEVESDWIAQFQDDQWRQRAQRKLTTAFP